jgi:hypothetical protein
MAGTAPATPKLNAPGLTPSATRSVMSVPSGVQRLGLKILGFHGGRGCGLGPVLARRIASTERYQCTGVRISREAEKRLNFGRFPGLESFLEEWIRSGLQHPPFFAALRLSARTPVYLASLVVV